MGEAPTQTETVALNREVLTEEKQEMGMSRPIFTMPNFNIVQPILGREYLLATMVKNISASPEVWSATLVQPVLTLRTATAVQRILSLYNYYRFKGVRIRIVVKSLPQQYGFALVQRCAYYHTSQTNLTTDGGTLAKDPIVLTINDQEAAEFTLPWLSTLIWLDPTGDGDEGDLMWTISVANEASFKTDTTVSSTYTMYIFASFIEPEVCAPIDPNYSPEPRMKGQSGKIGGPLSAALGTAFIAASAMRNANIPQDVSTEIPERASDSTTRELVEQKGFVQSVYGQTSLPTHAGAGEILDFVPDTTFLDSHLFADPDKRHRIRDLIMRPQWEGVTILNASAPTKLLKIYPNYGTLTATQFQSIGYMAWFSQFFRRWRGSIKVMLMFTTSSFISARIFVKVLWGDGLQAGSVGDFHTDVLTIKGNLNHCLTVPYVYPQPWHDCVTGYGAPQEPIFSVELESITSTGTTTPNVAMMVWFGAGEDFVYDSYQLATTYPGTGTLVKQEEKEERCKGQTDVTEMFKSPFPVITGFADIKPAPFDLTVEDLLMRWSGRGPNLLDTDARVHSWTSGSSYDPQIIQNWDFLCNMFLYNSGSVRRKIFYDPSISNPSGYAGGFLQSIDPVNYFNTYNSPCQGAFGTNTNQLPVMDVSCPYIAGELADRSPEWATPAHTNEWQTPLWLTPHVTNLAKETWIKAGFNFMLHYLMPLPGQLKWPWFYNIPPRPSKGKWIKK